MCSFMSQRTNRSQNYQSPFFGYVFDRAQFMNIKNLFAHILAARENFLLIPLKWESLAIFLPFSCHLPSPVCFFASTSPIDTHHAIR